MLDFQKPRKKAEKFLTFSLLIIFSTFSVFVLGDNFVFGEEDLAQKCKNLAEQGCQQLGKSKCKKELERCEQYYQKESQRIEADISKTAQEKRTLQNEIYTLRKKIQNLDYQIYQSNLVIKDIKLQIEDTSSSIDETSKKIEKTKERLAEILRLIYEKDQKSLIEILFAEEKLSGFYDDLAALEILNSENHKLLQEIKLLKLNLENQKKSLDEEKEGLERMVKIHLLQKEESARVKKEQEYYLTLTEREYQQKLKEKENIQKRAAEIRNRIFELVAVPKAPTFGQAYEIAKYVEGATGVRPAFLLAVLQQESSIGKNVGQCYLKNPKTGEGIVVYNGKVVSRVMKPGRDVGPFLQITKTLGRDPYSTPVSCPMSFGWGGAMGPAQFIPSTWMLYRGRLKSILKKEPDPWNIRDAFLAAGLYLADAGASSQTRKGEWSAAMVYFTGSAKNTRYSWYANNVLKIADRFERDISILNR